MPSIPRDPELEKTVREIGEKRVSDAFKQLTLIYGTAGAGSKTVKGAKAWAWHTVSARSKYVAYSYW